MPERNPFEETATAGRRPAYSQPDTRFGADTRFGGNLERANIRKSEPASVRPFPPDRNVGGYDPDPNKGKPFPVVENLGSSNLEKLMSMHDPKGLAYNLTNQIYNAYLDEGTYDPYATYGEDPDKQKILWQSAEMGEPGAVLVGGEWKKPTLNKLGSALLDQATTGTYDDQGRFTMDPFLGTDPEEDMFTGIPTTLIEGERGNIPGITWMLDAIFNRWSNKRWRSEFPNPPAELAFSIAYMISYATEAEFKKAMNEFIRITFYAKGLPQFSLGTSPVHKWVCNYCQFKDHCKPPSIF